VWRDLKEEIEIELSQIRRMLAAFTDLRQRIEHTEPTEVEIVALAGFLHAFYNGAENIFKRIAKHIDGALPSGEMWHSQLLDRMACPGENRPAVISGPVQLQLRQYMDFRHRFRHAHPFELKWNRMAPLVLAAANTLEQLRAELAIFLLAVEPKDTST
jgi:hypothetical protein